MAPKSSMLGRCPDCAASIPAGQTLIEYETTSGRRVYSECPECRGVVHPE